MSDEQLKSYFAKVSTAAQLVEQKTGIPAALISAIMSWETAAGTNATSKYNNELGIKYVGQQYATAGKVAGMYAGYKTQADFASDVARILSINAYGYPNILKTAKSSPSQWGDIIRAWNASSWAEADYNVTEIVRRADIARSVQGVSVASGSTSGAMSVSSLFSSLGVENPASMDKDELIKYAGIGALVVGVLALTK
ncbi:glucosaminidase domain-containing protein [Dehalobacter restrictus]|uniref:glucosaminidase domain-containing protein n=1 Tax=Dehalobacter restrictus TaxID=55583 RepID=UPI00338ED8DC